MFILKSVARALYICHQKGIAHKDIKLENVSRDFDEISSDVSTDYGRL